MYSQYWSNTEAPNIGPILENQCIANIGPLLGPPILAQYWKANINQILGPSILAQYWKINVRPILGRDWTSNIVPILEKNWIPNITFGKYWIPNMGAFRLPTIDCLQNPLLTSLFPTIRLRIKIIAYSSIFYMHFCAQINVSETKSHL